jgi:hypothetical protein
MSNTQYYGGGSAHPIYPTATNVPITFLAQPGKAARSAWLLAKAGVNADGPVRVRLVNQFGQGVSQYAEVRASSLERVKFVGVRVNADGPFPAVIKVEAQNRSTVPGSSAVVEGVLLEYRVTEDMTEAD